MRQKETETALWILSRALRWENKNIQAKKVYGEMENLER